MDKQDKIEREQRLAAALRANLQRRKQQARQRTGAESSRSGEPEQPDGTAAGATRPAGKA